MAGAIPRLLPSNVQNAMRIALIHANDGTDARVGKTCRSLVRQGFETHFIGWDRRPDSQKRVDLGGARSHVMPRGTAHGRWSLGGYFAFLHHVLRALKDLRPDVVCAVNEELAFLLVPFRHLLYRRLVCELYDPLDARHSGASAPVRAASRLVSSFALRFADQLIVTDGNRLGMVGQYQHKTAVIENVPEDPGPGPAERIPAGPVRIWAAGSLDEAHGLRELLAAIEPIPGVSVLSAGWPYDAYASETFVKHPRVEYRGIVTSARALELAATCDAVFCFYAPVNVNMINASPNKVNDALAVGRPVLINQEVKVADWVRQHGAGYSCGYSDVAALREIVRGLGSKRDGLPMLAQRLRELFGQRSWNAQESRLGQLYRDLATERG
jgi:hypothetical protein